MTSREELLRSLTTKGGRNDLITSLKADTQKCSLDEATLDKRTDCMTWNDIISIIVESCSNHKALTNRLQHLKDVLRIVDGRFIEHHTTMLSKTVVHDVISLCIGHLECEAEAVNVLITLFEHRIYQTYLQVNMLQEMTKICLVSLPLVHEWEQLIKQAHLRLLKWLLHDSLPWIRESFFQVKISNHLQANLVVTLQHARLQPDQIQQLKQLNTLQGFLEIFLEFTALRAFQGPFALKVWYQQTGSFILAIINSTFALQLRAVGVQIYRVFMQLLTIPQWHHFHNKNTIHLVNILLRIVNSSRTFRRSNDEDNHNLYSLISDLLSHLPTFLEHKNSCNRVQSQIISTYWQEESHCSNESSSSETNILVDRRYEHTQEDGEPLSSRARVFECPITTLFSLFETKPFQAVTLMAYISERHGEKASPSFLLTALRKAIDVFKSLEKDTQADCALQCCSTIIFAFERKQIDSHSCHDIIDGNLLSLNDLCEEFISLIWRWTSRDCGNMEFLHIGLIVALRHVDSAFLPLDLGDYYDTHYCGDTQLFVLHILLHTLSGHHEVSNVYTSPATSGQMLRKSITWLYTRSPREKSLPRLPSSWVVAQCLAIICSNHPPAIEQLRSQQSSMPSTAFDNRLNGLLNCWHLSEFSTDVSNLPASYTMDVHDTCPTIYRMDQQNINSVVLDTIFEELMKTFSSWEDQVETSNISLHELCTYAWQTGVVTKLLSMLGIELHYLESHTADAIAKSLSSNGLQIRNSTKNCYLKLIKLHEKQITFLQKHIEQLFLFQQQHLHEQTEHMTQSNCHLRKRNLLCCKLGKLLLDCLLKIFMEDIENFRSWRGERFPSKLNHLPSKDVCFTTVIHYIRTEPSMKYMTRFEKLFTSMLEAAMSMAVADTAVNADAALLQNTDVIVTHSHQQQEWNLIENHLHPRHIVEEIQAQCLDLVHYWRVVTCHTISQFNGVDTCTNVLLGDKILKDFSCPLLVTLAACQSIAQVSPSREEIKQKAYRTVLYILVNEHLESADSLVPSLVDDNAMNLAPYFNTILDVLTRMLPTKWNDKEFKSTAQLLQIWWSQSFPKQKFLDLSVHFDSSQRMATFNLAASLFSVAPLQIINVLFPNVTNFKTSCKEFLSIVWDRHISCLLHLARLLPTVFYGLRIFAPKLRLVMISILEETWQQLFQKYESVKDNQTLGNTNSVAVHQWASINSLSYLQSHLSAVLLSFAEIFHTSGEVQPRLLVIFFKDGIFRGFALVEKLLRRIVLKSKARSISELLSSLLSGVLYYLQQESLTCPFASYTSELRQTPYWLLPIILFRPYLKNKLWTVASPVYQEAQENFISAHASLFFAVTLACAPLLQVDKQWKALQSVITNSCPDRASCIIYIYAFSQPGSDRCDRLRKLNQLLRNSSSMELEDVCQGQAFRILFSQVYFYKFDDDSLLQENNFEILEHETVNKESPCLSASDFTSISAQCFNLRQRSLGSVLSRFQDSVFDVIIDLWNSMSLFQAPEMQEIYLKRLQFLVNDVLETNRIVASCEIDHRSTSKYSPVILETILNICKQTLLSSNLTDMSATIVMRIVSSLYLPYATSNDEHKLVLGNAAAFFVQQTLTLISETESIDPEFRDSVTLKQKDFQFNQSVSTPSVMLCYIPTDDQPEILWHYLALKARLAAIGSSQLFLSLLKVQTCIKLTKFSHYQLNFVLIQQAKETLSKLTQCLNTESLLGYSMITRLPQDLQVSAVPSSVLPRKNIHALLEEFTQFAQTSPSLLQESVLNNFHQQLAAWIGEETSTESLNSLYLSMVLPVIQHMDKMRPEVSIMLGRCLGELGPSWGYNPAEAESSLELRYGSSTEELDIVQAIIEQLQCTLLQEKDARIVIEAVRALRKLYQLEASSRLKHIFCSMQPILKISNDYQRHNNEVDLTAVATTESNDWSLFKGLDKQEQNNSSLWDPTGTTYRKWLSTLVCELIHASENEYLVPLLGVCHYSLSFCEFLLPFVVLMLVMFDQDRVNMKQICKDLNYVFLQTTSNPPPDIRKALLTLLKLVTTMREFEFTPSASRGTVATRKYKYTHWDNLIWLQELQYEAVAHASLMCGSKYSAILYCEIAKERHASLESSNDDPNLDKVLRNIMCTALQQLQEPDGIYAFFDSLNFQQRILLYQHEEEYDKLLVHNDLEYMHTSDKSRVRLGLVQSAYKWGLSSIPQFVCSSVPSSELTPEETEYMYESAWRLCDWENIPTQAQTNSAHKHVFSSLCTLRAESTRSIIEHLGAFSHDSMGRLQNCGLEDVRPIFAELLSFQMMREIEEAADIVSCVDDDCKLYQTFASTMNQWQRRFLRMPNTFDAREQILTLRVNLLEIIIETTQRDNGHSSVCSKIKEEYLEHIIQTFDICREFAKYNYALRLAERLKYRNAQSHVIPEHLWKIEIAKLLWSKKDLHLALTSMKQVYTEYKLAEPARLLGTWTGELGADTPDVVISYFEEAKCLSNQDIKERFECQLALARYTDQQCRLLHEKMASNDYSRNVAINRRRLARINMHQESNMGSARLQRRRSVNDGQLRVLERSLRADKVMFESMACSRMKYLEIALKNYLEALPSTGENYRDIIFCVCSLWFNHTDKDNVQLLIAEHIERVPTYQWLPLIYQLAARLDVSNKTESPKTDKKSFHSVLKKLVQRVTADHPHHVLFVLVALANGDQQNSTVSQITPKMQVAKSILDELETSKEIENLLLINFFMEENDLSHLVKQVYAVSRGYIQLATLPIDKKFKSNPAHYENSFTLASLTNVEKVAVITKETTVSPTARYFDEDVVRIRKWDSQFDFAGGINLPKIINCLGTDGHSYKQVVKGNDDSRQDAVMQQVFCMVNLWLKRDPECQRRRMNIRTFKVVPLSSTVGVLEWCMNTEPLGHWLVAPKSGAHERYRSKDWPSSRCRHVFQEAASAADKQRLFADICEHFKPVLRRFFTEYFRNPGDWFERRLAYTRSVAASSMAGYIIGLGDRHPNNILIDKTTAEVIHIDLGIAFERGKLLPTPETVPFRLTRDIVDGMGMAGVDGIFRRCCEKCLTVLRNSATPLGTILDVFIHDPLSKWKLTIDKVRELRIDGCTKEGAATEEAESIENEAQKILIKVQQKLSGFHNGQQLSVQGQVSTLIQEAMDVNNLSQLFAGWQPWV